MNALDIIRLEASSRLLPERRSSLGQYMTSSSIAEYMASLFDYAEKIQLLDAGAGVGSLTSAFVETSFNNAQIIDIDTWEIESILVPYLENTLKRLKGEAERRQINISTNIHQEDFIEEAVERILLRRGMRYTHCIINPPYKKINTDSRHRLLLREVGIETVNLYSSFVALSVVLLEKQGQLVAIIPRSFCNGTYYRPFRRFLLRHCSIDYIHLFESRKKPFNDDDVLQENIIIKLTKGKTQGPVIIAVSHDATFHDLKKYTAQHHTVIKPEDDEAFIYIPTELKHKDSSSLFVSSVGSLGLSVSTGPVVDFRFKEYCSMEPNENTAPLLYPHHFNGNGFSYPKKHKKPNGIMVNSKTQKLLFPKGFYVLVKRLSSKEEKRRITAYVVNPNILNYQWYGFENHFNVFHAQKAGLEEDIAYGLATFLNSTEVDRNFRIFSGHTQVNATDLRLLRYPDKDTLERIGREAKRKQSTQELIDSLIQKEGQE